MHPTPNQLLSVQNLIGSDLERIWTQPQFETFCQRDFLAPAQLRTGSLLFLGINPSYLEADQHIRYYNAHEGKHSFFAPFKRIAAKLGQPWSHFDMLFQRETDQKAIDRLLQAPDNQGVSFVWEQLQLSKRLLDAAQPTVIVVCNTKAREFLGMNSEDGKSGWLNLDFQWDDELGTYRYNNIPTFFSSMLSGQRALDIGSYRRLVWHINRALQMM